jgi:hypothetical protein
MATETRRVSRAFLEAGVISPNTKSNSLVMLGALGRAMSSVNFIQFGSLPKRLVDDCMVKVDALSKECFERFIKVLKALNLEYVVGSEYVVLISLRLPVGPLKQWVDVRTIEVIVNDPRFTEKEVEEIPDRPQTVTISHIRGWVVAILQDRKISNYLLANNTNDVKDLGAAFKVTTGKSDRGIAKQAFEEAGLKFENRVSKKNGAVGCRFFFFEEEPDLSKLEIVLPDWRVVKPVLGRRNGHRLVRGLTFPRGLNTARRISTHRGYRNNR